MIDWIADDRGLMPQQSAKQVLSLLNSVSDGARM